MRTLGGYLATKHNEGVKQIAGTLANGKEVTHSRGGLKPFAVKTNVCKFPMNLGFRAPAASARPDNLKNVRTSALQLPEALPYVPRNANLQQAGEFAPDNVGAVRQADLSDKSRGRKAPSFQRLIVDAISDDLRLGAVSKLGAASVSLAVQLELVPEKRAAFAHVNSHAANVAGTDCGAIRGANFPLDGVCSPSFPLVGSGLWAKHHAGVAELVDALDLGSGRRPNTIKALGDYLKVLWGLACNSSAKPRPFLPLTQTSTAGPDDA